MDAVSLDWLTGSAFFSSSDRYYDDTIISQLADAAQIAGKTGKGVVEQIGGTEVLVHYKSDQHVRADLHGCRAKFKLPPYAVNDAHPAVTLEWSGEVFYNHSALEVCAPMMEWIHRAGGHVEKTRVSRVDVAVDLAGVDVDVFRQAEEKNRFVTRAKVSAIYKNEGQVKTLYIGNNPVMVRIYDKLAQLRQEKNAGKMRSYELRTKGASPVARVEFQVRGEKLKQLEALGGVYTLPGILCGWGNVGKYCATDFCRMVTKRTTKTADLKTTPEWQRVLGAMDRGECFNVGDAYEVAEADVLTLMRSAAGTVSAAALQQGKDFANAHELKSEILKMIDSALEGEELKLLFEAWKKKRAARHSLHQQGTPARA